MVKTLADIIENCKVKQLLGDDSIQIKALVFDSRKAEPGCLFFAIKGTSSDGHEFIEMAIQHGSCAIVCEQLPAQQSESVAFVLVENSAYALAMAASSFYDHPSAKLFLTGVTGTNGKTTIATLLHELFETTGHPSGLLSTISNKIGNQVYAATHTTPDPVSINALLYEMAEYGCSHVFMEVSSHAMSQMRTFGLRFAGGIFTNLTHDHLDYHGSFAAYRDAKKLFFDILPAQAFALVNSDDKNARVMVQNTRARIRTYAIESDAEYRAKVLENQFEGLLLSIQGRDLNTRLIGRFNAYNILAIYGAAIELGMEQEEALKAISRLKSAEGRFEFVRSANRITGIVDYAHTPDALQNILKTINEIRTHNEKLITVAGAGGNRDRTKRPQMAKIAADLSDRLILTSDNPRNEDPLAILDDMRKGVPPQHFKKTIVISDRREAIHAAIAMAQPGDIILVAGKGHEKYQEINGIRHHFDDKEELFNRLLNPS